MKHFVWVFIVLMLWFCKSNEKVKTSTIETISVSGIFEMTIDKSETATSGVVRVNLKNISDTEVKLFQPREKIIEHLSGNEWIQVKTLYCPCGASCPPPPQFEMMQPQDVHKLAWDGEEKWCEGMTPKQQKAVAGKYRAVFKYSLPNNRKIDTFYAEFEI